MRPACDCGECPDCEIQTLARRHYGADVEFRYLTSGDDDCRRTDVAIVRENDEGFVRVLDRECELLPDDIAQGKALLRARLIDLLGVCELCGELHAEEGIAS